MIQDQELIELALELIKQNVPDMEIADLQPDLVRGNKVSGMFCNSVKFRLFGTNTFYRIHWHTGYAEGMDGSTPMVRIRSLEKIEWDGNNESQGDRVSLLPADKLFEI